MGKHPIITRYDPPPIPTRSVDWTAYRDGWEPSEPIGYGATEEAAIEDLLWAEDDCDAVVPQEPELFYRHAGDR